MEIEIEEATTASTLTTQMSHQEVNNHQVLMCKNTASVQKPHRRHLSGLPGDA